MSRNDASATIDKSVIFVEDKIPATIQSDGASAGSLRKFVAITIALVMLNLTICEVFGRFIVFLGKPASSQNPQYDSKTLVADTLSAGDDNIVLCGDSLMKQGIFPELLTAKLRGVNEHIRVVNLATNAGSQKDAVFFLDYILKKHIKPRLVVFDFEVAMMGYPTELGNMEWGQAKSYLFNGVLTRPTDFKKSCEIAAEDLSYVVRQRGNIKHFFLDFLTCAAFPKQWQSRTFHELTDVNDHETSFAGMSPDNRMTKWNDWPAQQWRIHSSYTHSPKGGQFKYNPEMYAIIIKYCQQHQIPLMMVWLPHESSIYGAFWYQAPWDSAFFRKRFEDYAKDPYVFPLYLNTLPEDFSYFSDYRHLSTYGAVKATEKFAEALSQPKYHDLLKDYRPKAEKVQP